MSSIVPLLKPDTNISDTGTVMLVHADGGLNSDDKG
jgi:hypothetical protein